MTRLDFNQNPILADAKKVMEDTFNARRNEGKLSKVHDEGHVIAVSNYEAITANALMEGIGYHDLAKRAAFITALTGILHDIHREAKETEPHGPIGAEFCKKLWGGNPLWKPINSQEFDAIYRSIQHHEDSFTDLLQEFGDPLKGEKQQILPSVIAHSIKAGDGALEASGYRVLERRAFFVGKERMGKDITMFRYPEESHLAVLGESLIRLYGKLPIDSYPEWLKAYGQKLHAIQYKFLAGLLNATGMDEAEAARFMERKGFPKFEGVRERVESQRHLSGGYFSASNYPVLADEINAMAGLDKSALGEASFLLVNTIAQAESPEEGIRKYAEMADKTDNQHLKYFAEGMVSYRDASEGFVNDFEASIRTEVKKLTA